MANLNALANDLVSGAVQVLDLTAPLHSNTPILVL
ncbi:MAG: cyclase family protein, partial [Actinobacteria bacterium]|nr:cyclase family protein [Actinomycetota bacterium]